MKPETRFVFPVILLNLIFSCKEDDENINLGLEEQVQTIEEFLETNQIDSATSVTRSDGAVFYYYPTNIPLDPNAETQSAGNVYSILFGVSLLDGTVINPFIETDTLIFKAGANAIFPTGLDIAIPETGMRVGDTYNIILTSPLALGEMEVEGLIPSNSVLIYQIRLTDVRTEQEIFNSEQAAITDYIDIQQLNDTIQNPLDPVVRFAQNGISYKRVSRGTPNESPGAGSEVGITYDLRSLDGSLLQNVNNSNIFQFRVGSVNSEGDFTVIPGLDFAVRQMEVGERALFIIPSNLAYLESAQVVPEFLKSRMAEERIIPAYSERIDPYRVLVFDMILRGINE